jgi:hypothetical protein
MDNMVNLNVKPDKNGVKIRCAKVSVLLSLKHKCPLSEPELKQEAHRRNYNDSLVFNGSRKSQIPRKFNHILSKCISKQYIRKNNSRKLSKETTYELTDEGEEYINKLFKETLDYIKESP